MVTTQPGMFDSTLRWALVTGASAGIGAEFCRQLAAQGYSLVMVARRKDRLDALATEIRRERRVDTRVCPLDLATAGASAELAQSLRSENITVEFLVNNAGYGVPGYFNIPDWHSHAEFIQVMITAVCELTWQLLPAMQARKSGFIINVASLAGLVPGSAAHTLYGASKSFLIRFSESLAMENSSTGVRVSALCPGFTYSEFHDVSGTRELVSKMPAWMWMDAAEVVSFGIDSVTAKHRVVAVPGRVNRLIARLARWLPMGSATGLTRRMSRYFRSQPKSG
jgi:short-subunit dehydrogenase